MIEELKPYSSHRATGVYWLPRVPAHWEIMRSKHVFAERTELARAGDVQLSATQAYGVIPQAEFERRVGRRVVRISMHLDKRSHVEKGDFVISTRSFQGGLERAWASGAIRSSYVVLHPARELDLGYFMHLFKAQPYIKALQATGNFIRDGQDLTFGNFSRVDLPVPPRDEQLAIGRFLNHANRRIDQFIRAKKKLVALLNEQKQAIIHRAVTRGLDPNVKLKGSGVPWLGEIPAHWETRKLQHMVEFRGGMTPHKGTASFWQGHIPWVSPKDMKVHVITNARDHISEAAVHATGQRMVPSQSVLVVVRGMILARTFPTAITAVPLTINQDMKALLPRGGVRAAYLSLLLRGLEQDVLRLVEESGHGTRTLATPTLARMTLPLPSTEEQTAIVDGLTERTNGVERALAQAERELDLVREYRTRLISDVVTGQLDVRAAAASLPDIEPEAMPSESSDEDEDETDIEGGEAA